MVRPIKLTEPPAQPNKRDLSCKLRPRRLIVRPAKPVLEKLKGSFKDKTKGAVLFDRKKEKNKAVVE